MKWPPPTGKTDSVKNTDHQIGVGNPV